MKTQTKNKNLFKCLIEWLTKEDKNKKIHIGKICIAQNIFVNLNEYCSMRIIELFQCSLLYTKFCEKNTHI